ncbi:MAG: Gmad2 immunoglobulin-like domain-containing protein [Anaerolineae bacterium]
MRTCTRVLSILALLPLLAGCVLFGNKPTPLPWIPTATPSSGQSQEAVTPTAGVPSPTPTPTSEPTSTPMPPTAEPTATVTVPARSIQLTTPADGQTVGNPLELSGTTAVMPFEGTLVVRIYDVQGNLAAEQPIMADGEIGEPATFEASVTYGGKPGPGRLEVVEISPRDGSTVAEASVDVVLAGFPGGGFVEIPKPQADVTLPIKLLARVGEPDQRVNVTVTWRDGVQFAHVFTTLRGLDGRGLLLPALDRVGPGPDHPSTQEGTVEIHSLDGALLALQPVRILHPDDPDTLAVDVHWVVNEEVVPQQIRIPHTLGIGRAALEMLLWGPVPQNDAGYTTALPTPEEVLSYGGRGTDWGERVTLRRLAIVAGVAEADFSPELLAHPGGATRALLIRSQIEETLLQFSTVDDVTITVNGQPDLLEP